MSKVLHRKATVASNKRCTSNLYLIELAVEDIPQCLQAGQFIHLKIPGMESHILRRPFSVFKANSNASSLTILYQVVGHGSLRMTELALGDEVDILGPIGHGWRLPCVKSGKTALLVAGGVGAAPLFMHAQDLLDAGFEVSVILGAQTKEAHVLLDSYRSLLGVKVEVATDDGSLGYKGFCTDLLKQKLVSNKPEYLACCGPEPMMKAVSQMCCAARIPCAVSLEKRMACGIGCCLSCVVSTKAGNKRACVDGPVFDAAEVIWQ